MKEDDSALVYCPKCGHDFHSEELKAERRAISALAKLRDRQAEIIRLLVPEGTSEAN